MTKTVLAATVAAFALVGAASAATEPTASLVANAQNLLDAYGFNVDASTLSGTEVVGLFFIDDLSNSTNGEISARISSVIGE